MKIYAIKLFFILNIVLIGCERVIPFAQHDTESKLIISALASPDTTISIFLNKSIFFLNDSITSDIWESKPPFCVQDADITLCVNKSKKYTMHFDLKEKMYISNYRPKIGDSISIEVIHNNFEKVTSNTTIKSMAKFEIESYYHYYNKSTESGCEQVYNNGEPCTDTLMSINCKINDPKGEKNYYRLQVRSTEGQVMGKAPKNERAYSSNLFYSDNIIFYDKNRSSSIEGFPSYFSNVFDDSLFDGKEYQFNVKARQLNSYYNTYYFPGEPIPDSLCTWIEINLQHISKDLYTYLKNMESIACAENDIYAEPISVHTNIQNGYGIFGSLTSKKYILEFSKFRLDPQKIP